MADITMCQDKECTLAATCYRFTATPNEWRQSYFMYSPRDGGAPDTFNRIIWDRPLGIPTKQVERIENMALAGAAEIQNALRKELK